ncbi:phosphatidylinositol alpha-1,6-mannosyltransferase [Marinobacter segnicrescens]|uniref:Phosphatidylinositol alpha-1,6-mannosyltransferase n=1 Tax=Marinobacter segnicrescens TaxID=430453 RepID=A0A1I0H2E3_9GAMM|nr:glycosyltransferase family 4 protein [Marinobacter segnicrescens]SET76961.1 phosphatidylinositol alpha-1,6-mannosyltransferase [Marinobacter segnicrescens]
MRKILLVSEIFPPRHGGSGRWFWEIYSRFPEQSVACLVGNHPEAAVADADFPHPVYRDELASSQWGIRSLTGMKYYLRTWRRLARLAKQEQMRQVHCGRVLPEGLAALMLKATHRIPYSCYVHGEDVETALTSRELSFLTRRVLKGAERIIANSQNSKRILLEKWGMSEQQVVVMTPGVDIEKFHPGDHSSRPAPWVGRTVVLTVGRLQKRKGQDMMISALPELRRSFPDILYSIVGDGEEKERLQALVEELGVAEYVEFAGEINDQELSVRYRHCELFALPNRRVGNDDEGFGMVLLEAQACGKPILAGKSGGTREAMEEGRTGYLADCTSPDSLKEAVAKILSNDDERQLMGEAGRELVEEHFSWKVLAGKAAVEFELGEGVN